MTATRNDRFPTVGLIRRLTTFRPGRYALNALLWTTIWAMPIIPGLITKEFFDGLTGDAEMSSSVTMLIRSVIAREVDRHDLLRHRLE